MERLLWILKNLTAFNFANKTWKQDKRKNFQQMTSTSPLKAILPQYRAHHISLILSVSENI